MDIQFMIDNSYLPPATSIQRGKVYTQILSHENDCPVMNGGDRCTCKEVTSEVYESVPDASKGKTS